MIVYNVLKKREYYREMSRRYYQSEKGKEIMRKNLRLRRARKNNIIHTFTAEEWKAKLEKTKGICPKWDKYVGIDKLTLDHIIPIKLAYPKQEHSILMIEPLCFSCNSSKNCSFTGEDMIKLINNLTDGDSETNKEILKALMEMYEEFDKIKNSKL